MNRKTIRWAHLALTSCVAAVFIGCDRSESASLDQQASAIAVRASGGDAAAVAAELTTAAEGSLPVNIQSQQLLGQAKLSDARALASNLRLKQSKAESLLSQISNLTSLAGVTSAHADANRQLEPTASVKLITDIASATRGDGNAQAIEGMPSGSIPTLAAVKQQKSKLEGELAKAQEAFQSATAKRDQLLTSVGTLSAQADAQRGEAKLETVKQAAAVRQQSALVSRTLSETESRLALIKADLEVQSLLETQLDSAVKSFEAQKASIETGWTDTKAKADAQAELASTMLSADATENKDGSSVKVLTAQLNDEFKQLQDLHEQAIAAFDAASASFDTAKRNSDDFKSRGGQASPAQAPARDMLKGTLDGDRYNLQKAVAKRELANVHASYAQFLLRAANTAMTLEEVGASLRPKPAASPEPLNSEKLKAAAIEEVKKADEILTETLSTLEGISASSESVASLRPLKASTRIFANYDRALLSQLAMSAGMSVDVAKEQTYKDSVEAAKAVIVEAREASIRVPNVPAEIYVAPPKVAEEKPAEATPAEQPADSPEVAAIRTSITEFVTSLINPELDEAGIDGLLVRIKSDESSAPLVAEIKSVLSSRTKLRAAVKAKFAEASDAFLTTEAADHAAAVTKAVSALKIGATDETNATVGVATATYKLVKEEDVWKLDLTGQTAEQTAAGAIAGVVLKPVVDSYTQFTTDIEAGKYATFEEFDAAWKAASAPATPPATEPTTATPAEANPGETPATPPADKPAETTPPAGETPPAETPPADKPPTDPAPGTPPATPSPETPPAEPPVQP